MSNSLSHFASAASVVVLFSCASQAAEPAVDAVFVGNVSQGGRYEVEASKLAEKRASAADVKDQALTEVHDHERVNASLKKIADASGIALAPELNAMFKERLAKLSAASAGDFDKAYIDDMKSIHDKDEKLFAKEAVEGGGDFKAFAHETDAIVKRHIGALHGTD
jgi:putative membrane protein